MAILPMVAGQVPEPTRALRAALDGETLRGVSYSYLADVDSEAYVGDRASGIHADVQCLILRLSGGTQTLTWAIEMVGPNRGTEGLALVAESGETVDTAPVTDVSASRWAPFVGRRINAVEPLWTLDGADPSAAVWAIRLVFATGTILVALGGLSDDLNPQFMSDELLVIFDPAAAARYVAAFDAGEV